MAKRELPKNLYSNCSKCKKDKTKNRAPYCAPCQKEYQRKNRQLLLLTPNINIEGLKSWMLMIENRTIDIVGQKNFDTGRYMLIGLEDISDIIFFWEIISYDMSKYDEYSSGRQIKLMWEDIMDFYRENKDNKKEIKCTSRPRKKKE